MRWPRRMLAVAALGAWGFALTLAVEKAFHASDAARHGVLAAQAAVITSHTSSARFGSATVRITRKSDGTVCFVTVGHSALRACMQQLGSREVRVVSAPHAVAGVAGTAVRAVIVRLNRHGTTWAKLNHGALFAVIPSGYKPRRLVKVFAGGARTTVQL
jgi:hypothetical protein